MASRTAIEVESVAKEFRVQHRSYGSLKTHAVALAKDLVRKQRQSFPEIRSVLRDVTFSIEPGEAVALVGTNGSGKSTLLSILSRVYLPTSGHVVIRGRMVSLLELGAGFHQELTGVENVFFNGAVLGLSEADTASRYDEIVEFSGLDPATMDLPVRMYSSGMQMRLGFATAIHMDADNLLIDEGLAVGDEGFQEKCFAKIQSLKSAGVTTLMVSHELDHVERLADRVLWLNRGELVADGPTRDVLAEYRKSF